MDPGGMMMNEGGYSLTEIWPFPMNGSMELGHVFGDNRDVCGGDGMVLDKRGGPKKRREEDESGSGSGKGVSTSTTANDVNDFDSKRLKTSGDENDQPKADMEVNSGKPLEQSSKPAEQPKQDYIHVRARRGQATDSHSLAERARREKISERMKILQDIVPGCNKVIGKALVLDEIINYIQSLQHQVEFLSMKLEAVNSRPNPGIEGFPSKDFDQKTFDMDGFAYTSQATKEYSRDPSPEWLHMQIGGSFERTA